MTDFPLPSLGTEERVYRVLLHLYPPRFRRVFALDLVETFRDQRRDALRHGVAASVFWSLCLRDLFAQAAAEWGARVWRLARNAPDDDTQDSAMAALPHALRLPELRYAARRLVRAPAFTTAAVVVLALGIGATTAVFSIVNAVLLRPLPYRDPSRLVYLGHRVEVGGVSEADQSDASVLLYQEHARAFSGIAATRNTDVNVAATTDARAERVAASGATANFLDVLEARPEIGRAFRAGEDRVGAAPVVLLSHAFWIRRFGGDPAVVGRRVAIDGISREVVGVMPEGFAYPSPSTAIWYPIAFDPRNANAGSFNYAGIGRLRDGVSIDAARADLARVLPRLLDEYPSGIPPAMWAQAHIAPVVMPLRDHLVGDVTHLLWILLGSVVLVLAIACANVANLFLVRGEGRQLELAVRSALGSGFAGIVAQSLSESLVLAGAGGALGVALAMLAVRLTSSAGAGLGVPRLHELSVDSRVLLFSLALSALCAAAVSLLPLLRARRVPIAMVIRAAGRGNSEDAHRQRARSVLVVAQVALALVLVAVSGLFARSFARLRDVNPGFTAADVVMARIAMPRSTYTSPAGIVQVHERLLDALRAIPGIRAATLTDWVPLTDDHNDNVVGVEDHPLPADAIPRVHPVVTIDGRYFETMRIPILAGRTFGAIDPARPLAEAIVSRSFAERYWSGASPLGRRIRQGLHSPWLTIVGVAGDVHYAALDRPPEDAYYVATLTPEDADAHPWAPHFVTVLVRTAPGFAGASAAIRNAVRAIDPALPTYDEQTLTSIVAAASARARVTLVLLGIASALALILGAVGIYGVMAYGVSLRQREIGVRIALGARPVDVRRMISRQGVTLGAVGVGVGVVGALAVTRLVRGLLYDVSPTDPLTLGGICVVLLLVALAASWIPARRAAAVDPADALRG